MSYWIDSHSHMIFDEFKDDFDSYIQRAFEANVKRIMCVCLNKEQLEYGYTLKEKYPFLDLDNPITVGSYMNEPDIINNRYQLHLAMEK